MTPNEMRWDRRPWGWDRGARIDGPGSTKWDVWASVHRRDGSAFVRIERLGTDPVVLPDLDTIHGIAVARSIRDGIAAARWQITGADTTPSTLARFDRLFDRLVDMIRSELASELAS